MQFWKSRFRRLYKRRIHFVLRKISFRGYRDAHSLTSVEILCLPVKSQQFLAASLFSREKNAIQPLLPFSRKSEKVGLA